MINAFLAIAIVLAAVMIICGVFSFMADMQNDAPREDDGKFGAALVGIGWAVLWGSVSGACAHGGHITVAIWIASVAATIEAAVAGFIWVTAHKMSHG